MSGRVCLRRLSPFVICLLGSILGLTACGHLPHLGPSASPTPVARLDTVFHSPTGRYSIRVDHAWPEQEVPVQGRILDYFTLPDGGAFSVVSDSEIPGTQLDQFYQATVDQYRSAHVQGLEHVGTIDVGPGHGELLKARTYMDASGQTAFTPPAPNAPARTLYQAFYVAGDVGFTFSIVWPQSEHTDYLSVFRSMLRTFTLSGAT